MRDILNELFEGEPVDPMEAARRSARPVLRKRFYKEATVVEGEGGFVVLLDGKQVYTPARRPLAAPTLALGNAIADEWQAQAEHVDPAAMPLTRLANAIIDGVADKAGEVAAGIVDYLGTDLVCYRADAPELAEGVIHAAQPAEAIAAMRAAIPADVWKLGAVSSLTALTGSALIALMLAAGQLTPDAAWAAAHVDEDFQMSQWGRDEIALARRAAREAEFRAACKVLAAR